MGDLQTFVLDDNKHEIIERISASGILYVTVDHALLHTLTFKGHVKVHFVFDNQKLNREQCEIQDQHNLCPKLEIEEQPSFDNSIDLSDNGNMHLKDVDDIKEETTNSFTNHDNSTYTGNYRLNNVDTISTCDVLKVNNDNSNGLALQNSASRKTSISRSNSCDNQSIIVANDLNCNTFCSAQKSEDMDDEETFHFSPNDLTTSVSVTRSSESEISFKHSSESEGSFPYPNTVNKHTAENHLGDMESCENVKLHAENVTADAYFSQENEDDTLSSESFLNQHSEKDPSTSEIASVDKVITTKRRHHYVKPLFCQYCSLFFKNDLDLYTHNRVDKQTFPCLKCKQVFRYKAFLLVHNMIDHKEVNHFNNASSTANSKIHSKKLTSKIGRNKTNPSNITCEMCPKKFRNISQLKTHTMIHTGENVCPLFKCCVCDEKFPYLDSLKLHMKTHSVNDISTITNTTEVKISKPNKIKTIQARKKGNYLVACKVCNISFKNRAELSRHHLTHILKCHLCDSVFSSKTARNYHYQTFHKDDNDIIKCPTCKRLFTCKKEYAGHIRHHKYGKKTQCPECGVFVLRLQPHIMTAHSADDTSLYVCDKCPKKFKIKAYLDRHLKSHIDVWPYQCDVCSKQFKLSHDLSKHMLTHSGEKPFVCELCGKACNRRDNLKTHMRVHQKPLT